MTKKDIENEIAGLQAYVSFKQVEIDEAKARIKELQAQLKPEAKK